jgi:hypothetical protein
VIEQFAWMRLPVGATRPAARSEMISFTRPGMAGAYIVGGTDGSLRNDFWAYLAKGQNTGGWTQPGLKTSFSVQGLAGSSAVYDERGQRAIVFGGRIPSGPTNQLFFLNVYEPHRR